MSNKPAYDANELRKQLKFITRNGPLRTVITDTESITGVALECGPHDHPEDRPHHIEKCCDEDVIEMWHEKHAAFFVAATTAIPALLDRVAKLEARPDEQPQDGYAVRLLDMLEADPDRFQASEEDDLRAAMSNLAQLGAEAGNLANALNAAYRERAHLVALLAALYPSHIGRTDPAAPDWAVVTVQMPTGQACWHIAADDEDLFEHVDHDPEHAVEYDGHSTVEKYGRIDDLARKAQDAQPERDGDGDGDVRAVALGTEIATTERATSLLHDLDARTKERDEARELACVSLDILRNVSDEPMRELYGVEDMDEMPAWFTRYGKASKR